MESPILVSLQPTMNISLSIWNVTEVFQNTPAESPAKRKLFIVISSDKGLCGGIHSSVSKATRRALKDKEHLVEEDSPVMVIGDKSKAQLSRAIGKNLALTFNQIGRDIPTFADAAGVADLIMRSDAKYDSIVIVYNKFVSALSYEATSVEVLNENTLKEARGLKYFLSTIHRLKCTYSWFQGI
jgi:F-type H+-transporting ATPase subunit gamma